VPALTEDIVLAGRDEAAAQVRQWLYGDGDAALLVAGETIDEVFAFAYSAAARLPPRTRDIILARSVIADSHDQAKRLGTILMPHILLLNEVDPAVARSLAHKGHRVLAAYPARRGTFEVACAITLPRPRRFELQLLLESLFTDKPEHSRSQLASQTAKDAGQSLGILRRRLTPEFRNPVWADCPETTVLRAVTLAGGWSRETIGDREILSELVGKPYDQVERDIIGWAEKPGDPLRKVGETWKVTSPRDAFYILAPGLTAADLSRFEVATRTVLCETDPSFTLPPGERWRASINGPKPKYSPLLQAGLCHTLALLGVLPDRVRQAELDSPGRATRIVSALLDDANVLRWLSLSSHLSTLAEAAPEAFLRSIEASLAGGEAAPVLSLLKDDTGPFERSYHANLLWGLEILAASKEHLGSAALILAKLARFDPRQDSRRPKAILSHLFATVLPTCRLPWRTRFEILRQLIVVHPELEDVFIDTLFGILPPTRTARTVGPFPEWRSFESDDQPDVTDWTKVPLSYLLSAAEDVSNAIVDQVSSRPDLWCRALADLQHLTANARGNLVRTIKDTASGINEDAVRLEVATALRKFVSRHRRFKKSQWAMPEPELTPLEEAFLQMQPRNPILRNQWLFKSDSIALLHPASGDWKVDGAKLLLDEKREVQRQQTEAIAIIFEWRGEKAVRELAAASEVNPRVVGRAVGQAAIPEMVKAALITDGFLSVSDRDADLAAGVILGMPGPETARVARLHGLLDTARHEIWPSHAVVRLLLTLSSIPETWDLAASFGADMEGTYWKQVDYIPSNLPVDVATAGLRKLIAVERAAKAFNLASIFYANEFDTPFMAELLVAAASEDHRSSRPLLEAYQVEGALDRLDKAGNVPDAKIAQLEIAVLPYLMHSSREDRLAIHRVMAKEPRLFLDVLSHVYRPAGESGDKEIGEFSERRTEISELWYGILRNWRSVPGLNAGILDRCTLNDWIEQARALCQEAGRLGPCDAYIGQALANAPPDPGDGIWPCRAVREILQLFGSRDIEDGLVMGELNKRDPMWRSLSEGGEPEQSIANRYRTWGKALRLTAPRAASVLDNIVASYDGLAKWHEDEAKRREW
jgi:hypothetical protein